MVEVLDRNEDVRKKYNFSFFDGEDYRSILEIDDKVPSITKKKLEEARTFISNPFIFWLDERITLKFIKQIAQVRGVKLSIHGNKLQEKICEVLNDGKIESGWYVTGTRPILRGQPYEEQIKMAGKEGFEIPNAMESLIRVLFNFLKNKSKFSDCIIGTKTLFPLEIPYSTGIKTEDVQIGIGGFDYSLQVLTNPVSHQSANVAVLPFKRIA